MSHQAISGGGAIQFVVSFMLAGLVTMSLLVLMGLDRSVPAEPPKDLLKRNVSVVPPPPPPRKKPRVIKKVAPAQLPRLKIAQTHSSVVLKTPPLELDLEVKLLEEEKMVDINFHSDMGDVVGEALSMVFEFDDLDQAPRIIHYGGFRFTFPTDLYRRGVRKGVVMVAIEIDTQGKASLISVESATHPQLIPIAKRLIPRARFAPLQAGGETVTARGTWPVHIQAPKR